MMDHPSLEDMWLSLRDCLHRFLTAAYKAALMNLLCSCWLPSLFQVRE
jgi:hypothetical protein